MDTTVLQHRMLQECDAARPLAKGKGYIEPEPEHTDATFSILIQNHGK